MRRRLLFLALLIVSVVMSCSKDDNTTGPTQPESVAEYIWLDTVSVLKITASTLQGGEYWLDGDYLFPEPFIDMNGDDTFEVGIDSFIISADPATNMDLNGNGHWDGHDSPYLPGSPYDDINENGVYDEPNYAYDTDEPFIDLNGNGVCDIMIPADSLAWGPGRPMQGQWEDDSLGSTYRWYHFDSIGTWVSDSGRTYAMPPHDWVYNWQTNDRARLTLMSITRTPAGLLLRDNSLWWLPLTDSGVPTVGTSAVTVNRTSPVPMQGTMRRTIETGYTLEIQSVTYENLLRIRFDHFVFSDNTAHADVYYYFYFSKDLGLLAGYMRPYFGSTNFFQRYGQMDSLPVLMVLDTSQP